MNGNFFQYSFSNKIYMLLCFIRTRLFYPSAKIIHFPLDRIEIDHYPQKLFLLEKTDGLVNLYVYFLVLKLVMNVLLVCYRMLQN